MKAYIRILLLGLCLFMGLPGASYAALDWHIRWDEANAPQIAKVYIFNPEYTTQTFSLEIGDVAKTANPDPAAPQLILGQDVSIGLAPSERKIFDVIVYQDIDPTGRYASLAEGKAYQLSTDSYRILQQNYDTSSAARQYPYSTRGISPVVREEPVSENRYTYKSGRGYWTISLSDHDYIAEQLIRTGDRMGALHSSIQQALLFYTQGDMQLSDESLEVWETAFPELRAIDVSPTPPSGDCVRFVTVVTANLSYYSSSRTISVGDILASQDSALSPVVAAEDLNYSVSPNTQDSKRLLRVFLMSKRGQPTSQSEYVSIINHNSQIEQAIRIGFAEQYHSCAIQDVIYYINHEVAYPTTGKGLWERIGGTVQPVPVTPAPGTRTLCLGSPTTQPGTTWRTSAMTIKNLAVLVGAILPFSAFFRRKGRK